MDHGKMTVRISEEMRDYVEALAFEVEALKDMLSFAMRQGLQDTQAYQDYKNEYKDAFARYQVAKQEMLTEYLSECGLLKDWNLDFASATLTYEVENAKEI